MKTEPRRHDLLILIGCFRLLKALLLIVAGLGALRLLHPGAASLLQQWIEALPFATEHAFLRRAASTLTRLPEKRMEELAVALFAYAALFIAEGTGLLLEKVWAEYLTLVATLSFIPFEVHEVMKRTTALRVSILVTNIAIVIYLIVLRVSARHGRR